ncbi:cupin domain-containing protein [Parasediminibacterium paludis]|uniref:Cupin domain-containing protein n=1 Tax=Parasediminibacterium paludis TaxID=908966 RepID=A0ABV8PTF6_9BACT
MLTAETLVNYFNMLPHPEGGYYKETYRSDELIAHNALPERFSGDRNFSTAIYFLLEKGNFSGFHKIQSDECWHFYAGQTLFVYVLHNNGSLEKIKLGNHLLDGEVFQAVVPAGCWFASEPAPNSEFSFVGCTVTPGFDFVDFELAKADELVKEFPKHEALIKRLCRL